MLQKGPRHMRATKKGARKIEKSPVKKTREIK